MQTAAQRADAANTAAQAAATDARSANAAAQAAATDARSANQRLDQLGGRVDTIEQARAPARPGVALNFLDGQRTSDLGPGSERGAWPIDLGANAIRIALTR